MFGFNKQPKNPLKKPLLPGDTTLDLDDIRLETNTPRWGVKVFSNIKSKNPRSRKSLYIPENEEQWVSKWKKNPTINPKNNEIISPSLDPKSAYVILYREALNSLIKERGTDKLLSIQDCEFIRNSLPDIHMLKDEEFSYDHLFTKYFIKKYISKYVKEYRAYGTDIFLYLELYNILKRKTKIGIQRDFIRDDRQSLLGNNLKEKRATTVIEKVMQIFAKKRLHRHPNLNIEMIK